MDREEKIRKHYLQTGILGAYEADEVVFEESQKGKYAPCFEDALLFFDRAQITAQRRMVIEGRRFFICSVFPSQAECTPTDRLLELIDTNLKNEL
ncbi:hypothetical protein [Sedimentibacter sp.]|uniref:hypothetical protein n=1 Tax=Sedimentibacter sp. TaxID=1960295 RepID=UPI0028A10912|nr:hypothetical protein [Sedimentibacter sp.]